VRLIKSVLHSLILITFLLSSSGCSLLGLGWNSVKPLEVKTTEVERVKLNVDMPKPIEAQSVEWYVVTPDNVEEVFKQLESEKKDLVLFAITDDGYEKLAGDMARIRSYIAQQRLIIVKYKDYYEPIKEDK